MHDLAFRSTALSRAETGLVIGAGAVLLIAGASRRSLLGGCLALAAVPLLYRGATGHWPMEVSRGDTRSALGGARGISVRESVRLERRPTEVYAFWRQLENLPTFMRHLESVTERSERRSHWVATGPAGVRVEWEAEIINLVANRLIAWQSLPGSDVVTAGSVAFEPIRNGRATQVSVHLQYSPPAGKIGAAVAYMFGKEPSQVIREDLRQFKQLLEAGEISRAKATA